jgi:hypothetical protein
MCEFSGQLMAWMDHELSAEETVAVERHLETCSECFGNAALYRHVSCEFDAYCDAVTASSAHRHLPRWIPAACAAGALAASAAIFLALPRTRVETPAVSPAQTVVAAASGDGASKSHAAASALSKFYRRKAVAIAHATKANRGFAQSQDSAPRPMQPAIEIAFPADEMFAPGAVPDGIQFVADVTIAPDGSAERLRLRPRLAGFERRTTQP